MAAPDIRARLEAAETIRDEGPRPLFRPLPTGAPFPIAALGPVLGVAAQAIETMIQCPLECAANSVLAVASLAAQGRANVILPIGSGKAAPLSLFLLTVLDSGERKSSADGMALKPVRDFDRELMEQGQAERLAYDAAKDAYEAGHRQLCSKMKGDRATLQAALEAMGPPPQPPLAPVLAPSGDPTIEGLFRVYQQGQPSLAMLCDDAATFLGGHSLKAEQKVSTTGVICRAWDGSPLERIRGGDGITVLHGRRLALHLMMQSGVAAGFLSDRQFADQGLLARFLFAAPAPRAGTRMRDDAAYQLAMSGVASELANYNAAIGRLLRQRVRWKNEQDRALGAHFNELHFTPDARALFVEFGNSIEAEIGPKGTYAPVRAFASKLAEHAARIAGILELMRYPDAAAIEAPTLAAAIELAKFYLEEALRLHAAGAIDPALHEAERLREWLLARPAECIGLRDVYRLGPSAIRDARKARAAMAVLSEHGWARPIEGGALIDGAAHKEAWEIVRC